MKVVECIWKKQFVDKLLLKHNVFTDEVEQVFLNTPRYDLAAKGRTPGENIYRALGRTHAGRYLTVFFVDKHKGKALPISAREMTAKERRSYARK